MPPLNGIPSHHLSEARRHQDRLGQYCDTEEAQRNCTAHTSSARFFKRRSPDFLQFYLSAGKSPPDRPQRSAPLPACSQPMLLHDAERIAIGKENAPAPQAVRPLAPALPFAPILPLDWRQLCSSKCPGPLRRRMRPAKITLHKVFFSALF